VYLPWLTPSNFSSSAWSTHWQKVKLADQTEKASRLLVEAAGESRISRSYLAWEVDFNGLNADILRARRHDGGGAVRLCLFFSTFGKG
jgi:hypothetical protein